MNYRVLISFVVVCLLVMLQTSSVAQEDPMDVFKPLLGTWTTKSETRPSLEVPKKSTGSGELNIRAILGGRFIQSDGYGKSPASGRQDYHVVMTYDASQKNYRRWVIRSDGGVVESRGTWDTDKKTMTWSALGLPANVTFTVTTTIAEGRIQETLVGKRADRAVTMDATFTSTKKK